jgi:hypothetical protein
MRRGVLVGELPGGLAHLDEIYSACYTAGPPAAQPITTEESDR